MYRAIALDPPWPERGGGKIKRGADRHYSVVDYRDIPMVVKDSPLWKPNPDGCLVFCWTTVNSCEHAYWLFRCLGVKPVTMVFWIKDRGFYVCRTEDEPDQLSIFGGKLGLGQYVRHDVEIVLIGRVGKVKPPKLKDRSWFFARPGRHSEKPQKAYDLFERMSDEPRAELFAREPRDGWEVWGNEV